MNSKRNCNNITFINKFFFFFKTYILALSFNQAVICCTQKVWRHWFLVSGWLYNIYMNNQIVKCVILFEYISLNFVFSPRSYFSHQCINTAGLHRYMCSRKNFYVNFNLLDSIIWWSLCFHHTVRQRLKGHNATTIRNGWFFFC